MTFVSKSVCFYLSILFKLNCVKLALKDSIITLFYFASRWMIFQVSLTCLLPSCRLVINPNNNCLGSAASSNLFLLLLFEKEPNLLVL